MSSTKEHEYREQADYCERMAHRAVTAELRASWLGLAQKWLSLIRTPVCLEIAAHRSDSNWPQTHIRFTRR